MSTRQSTKWTTAPLNDTALETASGGFDFWGDTWNPAGAEFELGGGAIGGLGTTFPQPQFSDAAIESHDPRDAGASDFGGGARYEDGGFEPAPIMDSDTVFT